MPKRILLALATLALPVAAAAQDQDEVFAHFTAAFADQCFWMDEDYPEDELPESWTLTWRPDYADTDLSLTLHRFFCFAGAYNVNHVYYAVEDDLGPYPVAFAVPDFDIAYEDDDFESAVLGITVTGFASQPMLANSTFDPDTGLLENVVYWRGIGDASSAGRWLFQDGRFVLKSYDVDASYDGEINPERIVDYP